jgi:hypothetical protein
MIAGARRQPAFVVRCSSAGDPRQTSRQDGGGTKTVGKPRDSRILL